MRLVLQTMRENGMEVVLEDDDRGEVKAINIIPSHPMDSEKALKILDRFDLDEIFKHDLLEKIHEATVLTVMRRSFR